jgi:hypothetical protein
MPFHQCNCLQQRTGTSFSVQNIDENLTTYLPLIMQSALHQLRSFDIPWQQFNKMLEPLVYLRTLHTLGTNKYHLFIISVNTTIFIITP